MPADAREIHDSLEEGIAIIQRLSVSSAKIRFKRIECTRMELGGFDSAGRRRPKRKEESPFIVQADMVIPAVSQSSDLLFVKKDEVEMTEWGTFVTDKDTLMTTMEGVFCRR